MLVIAPIGIFRDKASATIFVIPVITFSSGLYARSNKNHLARRPWRFFLIKGLVMAAWYVYNTALYHVVNVFECTGNRIIIFWSG